jgi:hypothetical protein
MSKNRMRGQRCVALKNRPHPLLHFATSGPNLKTPKVWLCLLIMDRLSPNFFTRSSIKSSCCIVRFFDLIYFWLIRRLRPLSVRRACFVTAGAIDLKLCTYVQLGMSNTHTKFWFSLILGLAKSAITPELISGSSPNFYHWYI